MDGLQSLPEDVRCYIQHLEKRITDLEEKNKKLREINQKLEAKLRQYENPHTPSSQQKFKGNSGGNGNTPGKRGAPKGHRGATRLRPKPDKIIDVVACECERCGSQNLQDLDKQKQHIIEDLPPVEKSEVTQYDQHWVKCMNCGYVFLSKHPDCPQVGGLGVRLMTQITLARFQLRGVLQRISEFLWSHWNFDLSVTGVHDVLLRVGTAFQGDYEQLLWKIRHARYVYVDETGIRVLGQNWWLWIFRTDTDDVLVVIRKSRGRDVLMEILGEGFTGAGVTDGWRVYKWLPVVQRCWAHLLREVNEYTDASEHGRLLSMELHRKFKRLKEFLEKDPPMKERRRMKKVWDKELQALVDEYIGYLDVRAVVKYIENGLGCWYTCLLYPGMQPTNNLAEQPIREHVIIEKIIGTFRSIKGSENYQYIASLLATWKLQEKNIAEETENLLRRELCLSGA
jgi:transposase